MCTKPPDAEKMEKLSATLLACGLNANSRTPIPTQLELAALLDETRGQPINPVHTGILRSMQKARYAPQPLVATVWCWQTTPTYQPIRRYLIWPSIASSARCCWSANNAQVTKDFSDFAAERQRNPASEGKVTAVRIERDVEDLYKADIMHNHLGEVYRVPWPGITPRGVFVELESTVEGLSPAAELCKG